MPTLQNIELFREGTWKGRPYTGADLDGMVGAFEALKGKLRFPVKLGHVKAPGTPAAGWIQNLRRAGNKLVADLVDVPKDIAQAWREKRYRQVSSEIAGNFKDEESGKVYPKVLSGLALLGAELPAVSGLNPDHSARLPADLSEIQVEACEVAACTFDLVTESGQIVERNGTDLFANDDPIPSSTASRERELPGSDGADEEGDDMDKVAELSQKVAELTGQLAASNTKIEELTKDEKDVETLIKERDELKKSVTDAQKQLEELAAADRKRDAEAFLAAHTAKDSLRILPAQRKYAEAILLNADAGDDVVTFSVDGEKEDLSVGQAFRKYVEALPDAGVKLFAELSEKGDAVDPTDKSAADRLEAAAFALMRDKADLDFADAVDYVLAEDTKLAEAYAVELKGKE